MSTLIQAHDLADYEDFINAELFAGRPLADYVAEVQRIYCADKRPWVIGYSGGKDSSAVLTLIYLALLGLPPEMRHKDVFVVSSDTLVETPVVVDLIIRTMEKIEKGAKRDKLPITSHPVVPKTHETFWVNLLGKGYPAPTRSFRWCTERMKINPVSDFIKDKVSQFEEVIVVLGSRSSESASRAQVIAKHKIDGSRLARHTTLANAFIYTPIDTWDVEDVWKLLRGAFKYASDDVEEWENPWGGNNRPLWTLYMDSSGQGECPLVIDDSTPSCGNSRFGCWTCTVVTKDRAMESLIQNGEDWLIDPNEPDWEDALPKIYRDVYTKDLNWVVDDQSRFDASDAELLDKLAVHYEVEPEMVMKLIELEISLEGLSKRQGVFDKIGSILKQDWGSLEGIQQKQAALQKRNQRDQHQETIDTIEAELKIVQSQLNDAHEISRLLNEVVTDDH